MKIVKLLTIITIIIIAIAIINAPHGTDANWLYTWFASLY